MHGRHRQTRALLNGRRNTTRRTCRGRTWRQIQRARLRGRQTQGRSSRRRVGESARWRRGAAGWCCQRNRLTPCRIRHRGAPTTVSSSGRSQPRPNAADGGLSPRRRTCHWWPDGGTRDACSRSCNTASSNSALRRTRRAACAGRAASPWWCRSDDGLSWCRPCGCGSRRRGHTWLTPWGRAARRCAAAHSTRTRPRSRLRERARPRLGGVRVENLDLARTDEDTKVRPTFEVHLALY